MSIKATTNRFLVLALIGLVGVLGWRQDTMAQTFDNSIESRDIQMELNPPTPGTNETVIVSLDSRIVNVNRMLITWFVDGVVVESGIGLTEITITTKSQGELTRIEAYIQVDNTTNLRKWLQIAPADLDILWQAETYTPPFYRGKALPTPESHIRIVGLPNLRNQGIQNLENNVVFNWRVNNENQPDDSGFGQNPLVIRNDFLRIEERVSLEVQLRDGLSRAERSVVIPITSPKIITYRGDSPLRNANNLNFENTNRQAAQIIAEPYHFSTRPELLGLLSYRWRVNGQVLNDINPQRPHVLDIQPDDTRGAANVSLFIENPTKLLQSASTGELTVLQ